MRTDHKARTQINDLTLLGLHLKADSLRRHVQLELTLVQLHSHVAEHRQLQGRHGDGVHI